MTKPPENQRPGPAEKAAIPLAVRQLAGEVLHNVSELEAALLARRWPLHLWSARTVSRSLKIGQGQAEDALNRLVSVGLLDEVAPDSYRYCAATPETSKALDALSALYHSHRQTVLRLLFSRSKGAVSYFPPDGRPRPKR
jgi:hypothetical protein